MTRQLGSEGPESEPLLGEHHRHPRTHQRERGSDLRADEAATDHRHGLSGPCAGAQAVVVVQRTEVADVLAARRQPAWRATDGEQQLVVREEIALVVRDQVPVGLDARHPATEVQRQIQLLRAAPDTLPGLALPECFRQGRPRVRRVGLLSDEADRARTVALADTADGGIGCHAATDHQVAIALHVSPPHEIEELRAGCDSPRPAVSARSPRPVPASRVRALGPRQVANLRDTKSVGVGARRVDGDPMNSVPGSRPDRRGRDRDTTRFHNPRKRVATSRARGSGSSAGGPACCDGVKQIG